MKGITIVRKEYVRFLNERQAAGYADMSIAEFRRECPVPPAERAQGRKSWDVVALDKWLDGTPEKKADREAALAGL